MSSHVHLRPISDHLNIKSCFLCHDISPTLGQSRLFRAHLVVSYQDGCHVPQDARQWGSFMAQPCEGICFPAFILSQTNPWSLCSKLTKSLSSCPIRLNLILQWGINGRCWIQNHSFLVANVLWAVLK